MNQIGILIPRSTFYETVGFDMFEGLRSGLKHLGREDIKIFSENIGFGTDQQNCYRVAERLIMQENLTVVFAFISHRTAQLIRPLFMATNRVLIVLDSGANLPQEWPESPNILFHSLHNSLGNLLIGKKVVDDGYKKAGFVSGYYDGGYLQTYAAGLGVASNGGEVVFNHATGYKRPEFTMEPLKTHRETFTDSALISIFSGDFVQWYFEELGIHFPDEQLPIYLGPFAVEEMLLKDASYPGENVKAIAAWSKELQNEENTHFQTMMEEAGWNANLFSLLSWEAATLAVALLDAMATNKNNGREALKSLKDFEFSSPRGKIRMHATSQTTLSPMYEAKLAEGENGKCKLLITGEISSEVIETEYEEMINAPIDNAISGWYNSYTCV